ncbi:MAG TPA: leucyl/phenylalanyl-tRNA--protein transferase, partial [Woeseiaceae bacterium]|nr:leucyl/phenylalanyl-tRNA--protein transferase [Woeseiaceae bacterium]
LHGLGWAHSVEIRRADALVGGVYGLAIGRAFFGESMFSRESNASKFALYALCRTLTLGGFKILDCQTVSRHLLSLGAVTVPRRDFVAELARLCTPTAPFGGWPTEPLRLADLTPLEDDAALQ